VDEIVIDTAKTIYQTKLRWLLVKYKAAHTIPYSDSKSAALHKVVEQALSVSDYNLAIIAATDIPYAEAKGDALLKIVEAAIVDSLNFPYSVIAAERIPYADSKRNALNMIVNADDK